MTYFLDANVISFFTRDVPAVKAVIDGILSVPENRIQIPLVAYYEVKRGLLAMGATKKLSQLEEICRQFPVVGMTTQTAEYAVEVYDTVRRGRLIEDADIFIAASALEHKAVLVTDNIRHLGRIPNLLLLPARGK